MWHPPTSPGNFFGGCIAPTGGTYLAVAGEVALVNLDASYRAPPSEPDWPLKLLPAVSANGVLSEAHNVISQDTLSDRT